MGQGEGRRNKNPCANWNSISRKSKKKGEQTGLISVIVTVYNIREYLPKAVDSILSSTYQNLEVLLIDDGSTDGSERICDEYTKKDGRVRVVHQKNGGAYSARNTGLLEAKGDYLTLWTATTGLSRRCMRDTAGGDDGAGRRSCGLPVSEKFTKTEGWICPRRWQRCLKGRSFWQNIWKRTKHG